MLKKRDAFSRVFSSVFYTVFLCVFFNIYLNLILIIIIITIIILWESFPVRVVCALVVACVPGGEQGFVKTFTSWQVLASLASTGSGVGGGVVLGDMFFRE